MIILSLILITSLFIGTKFVVNHSGTPTAKLTVKTYSKCLTLKPKTGEPTPEYNQCMKDLQKLVKYLIDKGEIDLDKCVEDKANKGVAFCRVWVWYIPRKVILTDEALVNVMIGRKTTVNIAPHPDVGQWVPSPERARRYFAKLAAMRTKQQGEPAKPAATEKQQ